MGKGSLTLFRETYYNKGIQHKNVCSYFDSFWGRGCKVIVDCDFLLEGKKIKIGNIVLFGTKKNTEEELPLAPDSQAG